MFPIIQSPCVFEPLPNVNMFGFEQPVMAPVPKRRRALGRSNCCIGGYMPSASLTSLRYTVDESPDGYTLWLSKKVPRGTVADAVNEQIAQLKEDMYRPTYHLVRDVWGNSYFVEEEADEESLLREALSKLDMKAINRKIARSLFQEYEIDLNHRGDQLTVTSRKDGITKSFEIGSSIEDIRVTGCKLDETQEHAVLTIELIKSEEFKGKSDDLANLIQWSQSEERRQRKEEEEKELEAKRVAEAKAKKEAEAKAQREAEAKKQFEAQLRAKFEADQEARRQEKLREEKVKRQQELKRRIAREEEEKRNRELARQEEEERRFYEQQLKERKAFLIEQQRAKRLRAEQQKSPQSPKTVTININFGSDDSASQEDQNSLRRYQSPVLEDVDDEETQRFQESLSRSPRGSSIIEDV